MNSVSCHKVPIILCADDFGIASGVSHAICELIEAERISATSCMVVNQPFQKHAQLLAPLRDHVDIGLHLTLTDLPAMIKNSTLSSGGKFHPLKKLMRLAFLHQISRDDVFQEINHQFTAFEQAFGEPPDFLDGHHHVHQLPIIREIALEIASTRLGGPRYVRNCSDSVGSILSRNVSNSKALMISALGIGLRPRATKNELSFNSRFSGIYDFSGKTPYASLFERFVRRMSNQGLIMCHPGHADNELRQRDQVVEQREHEFEFLMSSSFPSLLHRFNIRLARFSNQASEFD